MLQPSSTTGQHWSQTTALLQWLLLRPSQQRTKCSTTQILSAPHDARRPEWSASESQPPSRTRIENTDKRGSKEWGVANTRKRWPDFARFSRPPATIANSAHRPDYEQGFHQTIRFAPTLSCASTRRARYRPSLRNSRRGI